MESYVNFEDKVIFIPYSVPSSKNSRIMTRYGLHVSDAVKKWRNETIKHWQEHKGMFINMTIKMKPVLIGLHFNRKIDSTYDWVNPVQTILDEMVHNEWVNDDNIYQLMPFPLMINGQWSTHDKKNPGVYIKILNPNNINLNYDLQVNKTTSR